MSCRKPKRQLFARRRRVGAISGGSMKTVTFPRQGIGSMLLIKKSSRSDTNDFKSSVRRPCAPSSFSPRRSSRGPRSRTPSDTPACQNASGERGHRPQTWCRDDKSIIVVSAKGYVTAQASCAVQWVIATAGAGGSIYSAHMRCSSPSTPEQKTELNRIIVPIDNDRLSACVDYKDLKSYQRCPAN